jgi:hypothetical protein
MGSSTLVAFSARVAWLLEAARAPGYDPLGAEVMESTKNAEDVTIVLPEEMRQILQWHIDTFLSYKFEPSKETKVPIHRWSSIARPSLGCQPLGTAFPVPKVPRTVWFPARVRSGPMCQLQREVSLVRKCGARWPADATIVI